MLTYVSLFSGVGGLDLAVEGMGFECIAQVEWDESCQRVLERYWPDVPRWADVATYPDGRNGRGRSTAGRVSEAAGTGDPPDATYPDGGGRQVEREQEPARVGGARGDELDRRDQGGPVAADAARGGGGMEADGRRGSDAPSVSGRATSVLGDTADHRGVDLIVGGFPCQPVSTAGRRKAQDDKRWLWPEFARCIRLLQPRWVFIENVRGLLSAGEPAGDALREVVWDLAQLGYVSRWRCLRASDVGAPHRRERVFLLAERADADGERRALVEQRSLQVGDRGEPQPEPGRVDAAVAPDATDAARGSRGADAEEEAGIGRRRSSGDDQGTVVTDAGPLRGNTGIGRRSGTAEGGGTLVELGRRDREGFDWGPYAAAIQRWEAVMGAAPHPVDEQGRLSPTFVEFMMGFEPGWTEGMTRTQALKALGNAVVPQQAAAAFAMLMQEEM